MRTIRELRREKGWSRFELALKLGIDKSTLAKWEQGKFEPRASQLRTMASMFGVSMDDIWLPEDRKGAGEDLPHLE